MEETSETDTPGIELDEGTNPLDLTAIAETRRIAKSENYLRLFERVKNGEISASDASKKLADIDIAKDQQLGEFKVERDKLGDEVMRDPLTGLFNTRWYEGELRVRTAEANAFPEKKPTLLFFDIDFFKKINSQYGHPVGDEIIKAISTLTRDDEPIARIGGEEFVQLLDLSSKRTDDVVEDSEILKRIRDRYSEKVKEVTSTILKNATILKEPENGVKTDFATLSIGATQFHPGESAKEFHARANSAMHEAKNSGRDKLAYIEPEGNIIQYPNPGQAA